MPNFNSTLLPGARLKEFEIIQILGIGGFGITYLARDTRLGREVAIKEYFPAEFAARSGEQTISARSEQHADDYHWGLDRFIEEAQTLAHFDHPSIVRVIQFFEANGSAYIVMEHIVGHSLSDELKEKQTLPEHRVKEIVNALLDGLEQTHAADLLHRDIKPGNVMLREDGRPVLIDFGAARSIAGQHSRTITAVLTPGYAPIEQYGSLGKQGPWTDIYSLGALAYKCLSGQTPQDATDRFRQDQMPRVMEASSQGINEHFARAIDAALEVEESKRPQTITQWRRLIGGEDKTERRENIRVAKSRQSQMFAKADSGTRPLRRGRMGISGRLPMSARPSEPEGIKWWAFVASVGVFLAVVVVAWLDQFGAPVLRDELAIDHEIEIVDGSRKTYGDWHYTEYWADGQKMPIAISHDREGKGSFLQVNCDTRISFLQVGINFRQNLGQASSKHVISYELDEVQTITDEWLVVSSPANNQEQLLQKVLIDEYGYDQEGAYNLALDLAEHNRLWVRTYNIDDVTLERTFSLRGSRKPIFQVLRVCGFEVK